MSTRGRPPLERYSETPDLREGLKPFGDAGQAPGQRRSRLLGWAFSIAAHLMVFTALFWPRAAPTPIPVRRPPLQVSFVELPRPNPPGPLAAMEFKTAGRPKPVLLPPLNLAAPAPVPAASTPTPDTSDLLSESQLAGATSVGEEGAGGGGCGTARVLQQALRHDPLVHTAVEAAHRLGKTIMLWNGDWVRSGEQDGKGLSAVREAIMWGVAFAPEACRSERVHGLVLLSLADGGTRFVIGSGDWRWSDLLFVRGVRSAR